VTPLLNRIEQALATCTDPIRRAELLAERACYFARTGNFAGANAILASLRETYGDGRSARVSVWIMLAEGLILYFDKTEVGSRDRIIRAHLVSESADLRDLRQLTAVWLAHIEFNRSDFKSMIAFLRKVIDRRESWTDAATTRFYMIVADAYMYCGEATIAGQWYQRARSSAIDLGDQASIAALIYNKSALALAHMRIGVALDDADLSPLRFVSMEIESAYSFHIGTAHATLIELIETCRARALLMERRFEEARPVYESLLNRSGVALGLKSDRVTVDLEYAKCLHELGFAEAAKERFSQIDPEDYQGLSSDDQLIFLVLYSSVGRELGLEGVVAPYLDRVSDARDKFSSDIVNLKVGLDDLCANLSIGEL
jgi:tetratricopeptide (TPR) repeat protein